MSTTEICVIVGIITLIVGFILGGLKLNPIVLSDLIDDINFVMGLKNKTLEEENETFKKKILFFKDWFVRSYIEQYYRKKLAAHENGRIYTTDALIDLRDYAIKALDNFENTWTSEICNEQCTWIKEYLEELISKIDVALDDNWDGNILDRENEDAFSRFFVHIQTNMMFDRNCKDHGIETKQLGYSRPCIDHDEF